jgi:acyl-coenzyme A thioesterase PaaI-like protein
MQAFSNVSEMTMATDEPEVGDSGPSSVPTSKPWASDGREELADAVRRLTAGTVTSLASSDLLADVARRARSLADELEQFVPEAGPEPITRFAEQGAGPDGPEGMAAAMPFDVVIGSCNPLAQPIVIEFDPPKAIGRAEFGAPYEGAPGCVHGAVIAGAFDIVLTAANILADGAGPTVNLSIKYRKPTLVGQESLFEAWVVSQDARRTHSRGHLIQNGVVCVEAVGEFARMQRPSISAMHKRDERLGRKGSAS